MQEHVMQFDKKKEKCYFIIIYFDQHFLQREIPHLHLLVLVYISLKILFDKASTANEIK